MGWWSSISSLYNVHHTFKKSLLFRGTKSSAYVLIIFFYLVWCYIQLKHTNHVTHGISCWRNLLMGLPWHATSVKVLTIVASATQIQAYITYNPHGPKRLPSTKTLPHTTFWHWRQHTQQAYRYNRHEKILNLDGLDPEQYGSRKAKASEIQSLNTMQFYDIIRQNAIPEIIIFTYLVSNYYQVVHTIASPSLQRVNISKEPILCNFTTLKNMTHSVKKSFGDSKLTYIGDTCAVPLTSPHSLGKVNVASPAIWYIVSTPLINLLLESGHGEAFNFFISGDTTRLVRYFFVDDSTIV